MKSLRIKIEGVRGLADFEDFAQFAKAVAESLTVTHRRFFPERQKRPRFNVRDLRVGSAVVTLSPDDQIPGDFLDGYVETLASIRAGQLPAGKMSGEDLRSYKKLGSVLDSRTTVAEVGDVEIDDAFLLSCDRLIESSPSSLGQVVGLLQGVNTHRAKFFRIYPEGQDAGAECYLRAPNLFDRMMEMFDKRVRLTGTVRRNPDGTGVDRVDVTDAELMPGANEVPTLASLAGIWRKDEPMDLRGIRAGWDD